MVNTSSIIGMILSAVLLVGVLVLVFIRFRKKERVLSAVLWGVLTYFVMNVAGNLLTSVAATTLFSTPEQFQAFISDKSNFLVSALLQGAIATIAFTVSAVLMLTLLRKRENYTQDSAEVMGVTQGVFPWVNPLQSTILALVNYIMFSFALNRGDDILKPSENVTQADIDNLVKTITNSTALEYVLIAATSIALMLAYRAGFMMLNRAFEDLEKKNVRIAQAMGIYFAFYFLMQVLANVGLPQIVSLLGIIILSLAITFYVEKTGPKKSSLLNLKRKQ